MGASGIADHAAWTVPPPEDLAPGVGVAETGVDGVEATAETLGDTSTAGHMVPSGFGVSVPPAGGRATS
ncbi:MAG: hypothetical protein H0V12_11105 [Chloroflexi bacterium]|nr:hypothetical protein [Chloroflexota bacterium]